MHYLAVRESDKAALSIVQTGERSWDALCINAVNNDLIHGSKNNIFVRVEAKGYVVHYFHHINNYRKAVMEVMAFGTVDVQEFKVISKSFGTVGVQEFKTTAGGE